MCVCASWPPSIKLFILNLLLNPPLVFSFIKISVGVAFFPSHGFIS